MKRRILILVANLLLLEIGSFCLLTMADHIGMLEPIAVVDVPSSDEMISSDVRNKILHPYLGFVSGDTASGSLLGFTGNQPLVQKRSDNLFIIGVFGGSVAHQLSSWNSQDLRAFLQEDPLLAEKEIRILPIAMGGFKQPQQLMALNYLRMLGGEFDAIVNIDGFNEIAVSFTENVPQSVAAFFPRSWAYHLRTAVRDDAYDALYRKAVSAKSVSSHLGAYLEEHPHLFSQTVQLVLRLAYTGYAKKYRMADTALQNYGIGEHPDAVQTGPWNPQQTEKERLSEMADIWMRSSQLMHDIADAHGAVYVHLLQPNQYVPHSKELSAEEHSIAYSEQPYKHWVEVGYPLLQERGALLQQKRIAFTDLTQLFSGEKQSVYMDICCHFNPYGEHLVRGAIAEAILRELHHKAQRQ